MKTKEDTHEDIMKRIKEMISTIPTRNLKDIEKMVISVLNKSKANNIDEIDKQNH